MGAGIPSKRSWRREAIAIPSSTSSCRSALAPLCHYFSDSAILQRPGTAQASRASVLLFPDPTSGAGTASLLWDPLPSWFWQCEPLANSNPVVSLLSDTVQKHTRHLYSPDHREKMADPWQRVFLYSHPSKGDSSRDFFPSRLGFQLEIYFIVCSLLSLLPV